MNNIEIKKSSMLYKITETLFMFPSQNGCIFLCQFFTTLLLIPIVVVSAIFTIGGTILMLVVPFLHHYAGMHELRPFIGYAFWVGISLIYFYHLYEKYSVGKSILNNPIILIIKEKKKKICPIIDFVD